MQNDFSIPAGWVLDSSQSVTTLVGPEGDITIAFVELEYSANVEEIAMAAWKTADPAFNSKLLQKAAIPAQGGWDELHQIVYEVPAKDSRIELAVVRKLGPRAYINLVRGSKAAVSRRGAQLTEIFGSWKPPGYKEVSLKDAVAPAWTDQHSQQLKTFLLGAMAQMQIPAVSIAVVQGGRVVYTEGYGTRSVSEVAPVSPHTRFMIGSSTKPLTTLLMAKLVEQGKLSWSTPVVDLLKGFALADADVTKRLELRHTASASTGMPRQDMEFVFRHSGITPEQRMAQMKTMRPTTGFGETFQYSNLLVAAGGYAAARAFDSESSLEEAYDSALKELVFEPLQMHDTFMKRAEAEKGEAAAGHATDFDGNTARIPSDLESGLSGVAPAGAAWSTVLDMAQYVMLELGKGRMPDGRRVIAEDALLERRKKGIKIDDTSSYGLGLFIGQESGIEVIHHGGNTFGFTADMFFLPEKDLGVVVLTNLYAANSFTAGVRDKVFELMFGAEPKAEKTIAAAVKLRQESVAILQKKSKPDAAWVQDVLGQYECAELGSAEITRRDNGFWVQFDEWGSWIGFEAEEAGDRVVRLLNPPWRGALKLLVEGDNLSLDGGQRKYLFQKHAH